MQSVLNFSIEEKEKVKGFLAGFPQSTPTNKYEEMRVSIGESIVVLYSSGKLLVQGNDSEEIKEKVLAGTGTEGELLLGIDETGRGESTGPLVVAGVLGNTNELREMRDSKKTTDIEAKKKIVEEKCIASFVVSVNAESIDEMRSSGKNMNRIEAEIIDSIVAAARKANDGAFNVLVDGNPLPVAEKGIDFLPKADDLNPVVGAASILAKATRNSSKDNAKRKTWKTKKEK
jgi:ribonuclease HII